MQRLFLSLSIALTMAATSYATTYGVWVKGVQVSSANYANILGNGTVSYDPSTKTLTLKNANIVYDGWSVIAIYQDLTINCIGENTVYCTNTTNGDAISNDVGKTTITGSGTLLVKSDALNAIYGEYDLTISDGCKVTAQSAKGSAVSVAGEPLTIDGAILIAKGNGKEATINGCSELIMKNGATIRTAHTYDAALKKFLTAAGNEAKDDIIIGIDGRTVIKELSLSNLHAPTAGSVYTNDSMRASIRVPQDAGYSLTAGNVKLYKMTASGAAQVADNTVITTGRYYVVAQVGINEDAKEQYRFPDQLKNLKTKSVSPHKWFLKNLIGNEGVVCYSDTFTVFTAYAFPDEVPDDLTAIKGDTIRIYGNMISLSDASSNYKDLASSLEYHPKEFGYDPSFKKIYIGFGGVYWNIPQASAVDWIDVYYSSWNMPFTYDYSYQPYVLPTQRPDMKGASLVVCASNIENYFSNYKDASKVFAKSPATQEEFVTKTKKIVAAFTTMDAQIYALCEIGTGQSVHVLCDSLNKRYPNKPYAPLDCNFGTSTYQSVAYIYDSTKLDVVSAPTCMYASGYMSYRMSRVTFRERASQQELILSASHLKAFDDGENERIQQVNKLLSALSPYKQKNILIVGDMNSHSLDVPSQMLADEYEDLLYTYDSLGFSYLRGDGVAFLDHAYASPSLTPYVTMATTMHVNTLASSDNGFASGDTTMYHYADHDPMLIGLDLSHSSGLKQLTVDDAQCTKKIMIDGQLFILHDNKIYNIQGGRVK